jgi:hypothetical protein
MTTIDPAALVVSFIKTPHLMKTIEETHLTGCAWEAVHYKPQVILQAWLIKQQCLQQQVPYQGVWDHLSSLDQAPRIWEGLLHAASRSACTGRAKRMLNSSKGHVRGM